MPDTGAPFEIPFLDGTELVRDYPQFSEDLANQVADGLAPLAQGFAFVETVYFTSSGEFKKADYPWLRAIRVKVQGGGGGGGGSQATGAGQSSESAGGGGGGYAEKFITDIAGLSATETITRGAGGAGGIGNSNGSAGGNSSGFGVTGSGGGGGFLGAASSVYAFNQRGSGGSASGGDLNVAGSDGNPGIIYEYLAATFSNFGGGSFLGNLRNTGASSNTNGLDGFEYGGGGSGSRNRGQNSPDKTGGAGANGIVIVELYA